MDNYNIEFPAVRGIQAGRIFYTANIPFRALARMLQIDIGNVLDRSQRDVNLSRAKKVSKYIIDNPKSFIIPSLTGVLNAAVDFKCSSESELAGLLVVPMDAEIKLFDGQHRATGIVDAVHEAGMQSEMVPIMLFVDMSLEDRQQAFSDINGNASKPSQSLSDSYNQRDQLPILAKDIANNVECFEGLVEFEKNTVSGNSDKLFPLKTLKDATAKFLGLRKNDIVTESQRELAINYWQAVGRALNWSSTSLYLAGKSAKDIRDESIKTHGVMLNALGLAGKSLISQYADVEKIDFELLSSLNFTRYSSDFTDRCIQRDSGAMKSDATAVKLTTNKLLMALGCPLSPDMRQLEKRFFDKNAIEIDSAPSEKQEAA